MLKYFQRLKLRKEDAEKKEVQKSTRHVFTEEESLQAIKVRKENSRIRQRQASYRGLIEEEKLKLELAIIQKETKMEGADTEENPEKLLMAILNKVGVKMPGFADLGQQQAQAPNTSFQDYENQIKKDVGDEPIIPEVVGEDKEKENIRFSEEDMISTIPKLLNIEQQEAIKNLSQAEVIEMYNVIRSGKVINQ